MAFRLLQASKAPAPMPVTLLGIVMFVRLAQPKNVPRPEVGDAVGDRDVGQAAAAIEDIVPEAGDALRES